MKIFQLWVDVYQNGIYRGQLSEDRSFDFNFQHWTEIDLAVSSGCTIKMVKLI